MRLLLACLLLWSTTLHAAVTVRFASLHYPPYAGASLPEEGAMVALLREALAPLGYRVDVEYMPWTRALATQHDTRYAGILALWPRSAGEMVEHAFVPVFVSRVGYFARKPGAAPALTQLSSKRLGVVRGYRYPPVLLASGATLDWASDDLASLKKLAAGRLDYAVLEKAVGTDLLRQALPQQQTSLYWQEPSVVELPLGVGLYADRPGATLLQRRLEQALKTMRTDGRYLALTQRHGVDAYVPPPTAAKAR
ncbi:substrate-binding periplasmic protein [Chitinolyticbacter meiyuanensis]|uniref:substrate-binding periplasmic protein n=1 Tax=Chitinolyticbacter meiyuanensis TaxID=682798 RepID=UPI0011E601B7|nr:transporter substrate-binding domain-containing protein [Chitinolyticbacter meiyuanensis]